MVLLFLIKCGGDKEILFLLWAEGENNRGLNAPVCNQVCPVALCELPVHISCLHISHIDTISFHLFAYMGTCMLELSPYECKSLVNVNIRCMLHL